MENQRPEPICPSCKEQPRTRAASGRINPYCAPCAGAKVREQQGWSPAERTCERCKQPYRGNNRAKAQLCPDCRTHCGSCGEPKSPGDARHTLCGRCRADGKICEACGVNLTLQNNRECWNCRNSAGRRTSYARDRLYSLAPGQYDAKLAEQGGVCEISRRPETSVSKRTGRTYPLAVDHDRSCCPGPKSCGKCLRGLIRRNLNVALGMFGDDPDLLEAAAAYIRRHRAAARQAARSSASR